MPLSITTAGRLAAGSIRKRAKKVLVSELVLVVEVDLRLRSCRLYKGEDHGREGHFEENENKEEYEGGDSESDCD